MSLKVINDKVSSEMVLEYYQGKEVLDHYEEATQRIGLWKSEELVFRQSFQLSEISFGIGMRCGKDRFLPVVIGLRKIWATDFSPKMIRRALLLNGQRKSGIHFETQDATAMNLEDESFHGVIFGFNGLMQIPGSQRSEPSDEGGLSGFETRWEIRLHHT